jgi:peptide-methionine (S)-S-oxide reductase
MSRANPLPAQPPAGLAFATLAGGCFWCTEAVFEQVDGVIDVESGYTDGQMANPDYESVCTGRTGHAEAVRILFDPARLAYRDLLQIFMATHDPTSLNRQGNDVGTQYRSAIFFHDADQERVARELIASLQTECDQPIVTQLSPAPVWWRAEDYHQEYYRHHPHQGYCAFVIAPKLQKLQALFRSRLKKT